MAATASSGSPMTDRTNQYLSISSYDTANSSLRIDYKNPVCNEACWDEDAVMCGRKPRSRPSIIDQTFFHPPDATSHGSDPASKTLVPNQSGFDRTSQSPACQLVDQTSSWGTSEVDDHLLRSDNLARSWNIRLYTAPRPYGLPLDDIVEGGSYSSVRTKRSLSVLRLSVTPPREDKTHNAAPRRVRSAPDRFRPDLRESKIHKLLPAPELDEQRPPNHLGLWRELGPDNTVLDLSIPGDNESYRKCQEEMSLADGHSTEVYTWPVRRTPLRTPARSIRDIYEKLLASGFAAGSTSKDPRSDDSPTSFDFESMTAHTARPENEDLNRSSLTADETDQYFETANPREQSYTAQDMLDHELLIWRLDVSPAVASLRRILSGQGKGSTLSTHDHSPPYSAFRCETLLYAPQHEGHDMRPFRFQSSGGFRISEPENPTFILPPYQEAAVEAPFTTLSNKEFVDSAETRCRTISSTTSLRSFRDVNPELPAFGEHHRKRKRPTIVPFDDPVFDSLRLHNDLDLTPAVRKELTPSPLRIFPRPAVDLSPFTASDKTGSRKKPHGIQPWRSISSLLRFSTRSVASYESTHGSRCRHNHRIISQSTYSGAKIRHSKRHTQSYQLNRPETCWRCSVKDTYGKVKGKLAMTISRKSREDLSIAPLFVGASTAIDGESIIMTDACGRLVDETLSDRGSSVVVFTNEQDRARQSSPARGTSSYALDGIDNAQDRRSSAGGQSRSIVGSLRGSRLMTWITKHMVLCIDDDTSTRSRPCRRREVQPAITRRLID